MKIRKTNKNAMISKQLLAIIILIISFAVLLMFYLIVDWNPKIDKESCHTSIVLRSTFNSATKALEAGNAIPLKCKTEKICFTISGEDCEAFGTPSKENQITRIKLNSDPTKSKETIKETIANALYDCNSMLGEGKLDFLPHKFWTQNYGLICSRFAFDKQAKEDLKGLGYGELYLYLQNKKIPDGRSYLEYLYPGIQDWAVSKTIFEDLKEQSQDPEFENLEFKDWKIQFGTAENGYAIIAQMKNIGTWGKYAEIAGVFTITIGILAAIPTGGTSSALVSIGLGLLKTAVIASAKIGSGAIFIYDHPNGKYNWIPPTIYPYNKEALEGLGCSSFETAP